MLSEISHMQKDKCHVFSHMWHIYLPKKTQNENNDLDAKGGSPSVRTRGRGKGERRVMGLNVTMVLACMSGNITIILTVELKIKILT
jgi:hypothetical protein